MTILNYLKKTRQKILLSNLILFFWRIYGFLVVSFFISLMLENIFYLSPETRSNILLISVSIISIAIIGYAIHSIIAACDLNKKYKLSSIALKIGSYSFDKKDALLNAFQLENTTNQTGSLDLQNSFIKNVQSKIENIDQKPLLAGDKIFLWKRIAFWILLITNISVILTWNHSVSALYRLAHAETKFLPPMPFNLTSQSKYIGILGGESANVEFISIKDAPDSINVEFKPLAFQDNTDSVILKVAYNDNGTYRTSLDNIYQNYRYRAFVPSEKFWNPWSEISSKTYSISVTDRPSISDVTFIIESPEYTRLPPKIQKANQTEIQAILGSEISVALRSNKKLDKASLILDENKYKMSINNDKASFKFNMEQEGKFFISLQDERGITNRNPIPFHLKTIPDLYPRMSILKPAPIIELGGDQTISIRINIEDDFGFSKLQVAYEIHRPDYIDAEPKISMFNIPIPDNEKNQQEISTTWSIGNLGLMPDDEIHFHFELYDNDPLLGPKKEVSSTFIARIPSLNDLFASFENSEDEIIMDAEKGLSSLKKIKEKIKQARLDLLKTDDPSWEQQQKTKESLKGIENEISNFQKLNEKLNSLNNQSEKHDLFSEGISNKFKELQKLVEEIFPPEMFQNMDAMKEALEKLDVEEMISALENISNNMDNIEKELDRFLDIFQRIKAEQKVDEIRKRVEQLVKNQDNLDQQIRSINKQTDSSVFKRLAQEQKITEKELNDIIKEMKNAINDIKKVSRKTAQELEGLSESGSVKSAKDHLKKTTNSLDNRKPYEAMDASYSGMQSMQSMESSMNQIFSNFQKQSTREMAKKFRVILRDVLSISKSQELLKNEAKDIPSNSPRKNDLASNQQLLQDQLFKTMNKTMNLSKETFLVTPEMGKSLGVANAQMSTSKTKLAERDAKGSLSNQEQAMAALNKNAKLIIQTINKMNDGGTASGYEEFLEQMKNMSAMQKSVNDQGMQLALGQMASSLKGSMMSRMLSQQRDIQNSLKQMMNEMNQSGKQGLGDLNGIASEIDKVIDEIAKNNFDRNTSNRQQKILSRMLNSQKSMTQRGFEDERKSKTASQISSTAPLGLPSDLGQRKSIIMEAMDQALSAGFSKEYQRMIQKYFNSLNSLEAISDSDTLSQF